MASAVVTASSEHILIHHSQEASNLGTQAHQLYSYSDSKMTYTGFVICWQPNFYFRDPCDFFSFHCWQFGSVTMKVQPSLSNISSFFAIHGDYVSLPALTPCRTSENATVQVRDFSPLPSSLSLAFRDSIPCFPTATRPIRAKPLPSIIKQPEYFNPLDLKYSKIASDLEDSLQFWESWWQN